LWYGEKCKKLVIKTILNRSADFVAACSRRVWTSQFGVTFKTSVKIYDNNIGESTNNDEMPNSTSSSTTKHCCYAILMYVDHMNNGKRYRKWSRKNASELDLWLWIRHLRQHEHESYLKDESNEIEIENHRRGPLRPRWEPF
jgi:hypothetical protein